MTDIPPLAGWPGHLPEQDPTTAIVFVYQDLQELHENLKLVDNEAWLTKFEKNALDLDLELEEYQHTSDPEVLSIRNWFKNARVKGNSLSDALMTDFKEVKRFLKTLIKEDYESLESLMGHFEQYLSNKSL